MACVNAVSGYMYLNTVSSSQIFLLSCRICHVVYIMWITQSHDKTINKKQGCRICVDDKANEKDELC